MESINTFTISTAVIVVISFFLRSLTGKGLDKNVNFVIGLVVVAAFVSFFVNTDKIELERIIPSEAGSFTKEEAQEIYEENIQKRFEENVKNEVKEYIYQNWDRDCDVEVMSEKSPEGYDIIGLYITGYSDENMAENLCKNFGINRQVLHMGG